ncbi:MAG TPA: acyl-CoA dehydrogenase family protein, partial [Candidatus Cybelea sp.]|nr:acyl-CoA dehydrogenase family protein [Candidatus Cybelea sp.]
MLAQSSAQFELSDEQRAIGALAAEIAQRAIAPHVAQWDREHVFPRELYRTLTEAGIMGILVPEEYGGAGADYLSYALAIEELARVDAGTAVTVSVHSMICSAIVRLGTAEQKERWLPQLATSDTIAGFALTESDAGSDAAALRATAKRSNGGYVLNGRKQWCTSGSYAGVIMGMFRTGDAGSRGVSAFLIESMLPGIAVERVTEKLGIHTS